jgi:phosphotriesterase-related protein
VLDGVVLLTWPRFLALTKTINKILLSQDACLKTYTRRYGGRGYDHILRTMVPMIKRIGLTDTEINQMMIQNPARVLAR